MKNNIPKNLLCCPKCKSILSFESEVFFCQNCKKKYPLYLDTIPIFLEEANSHILNSLIRIEQYLGIRRQEYSRMKDHKQLLTYRKKDDIDRIINACQVNDDLFIELKTKIEIEAQKHIDPEFVQQFKFDPQKAPMGYISNLKYLIRDWCKLEYGENEVNTIKQFLVKYTSKADKILFIGDATGRLSSESVTESNCVISLDYSFAQSYLFERVRNGNINFFEENFKNVEHVKKIVTPRLASSSFLPSSQKQKVVNLIGSASYLPFANSSLSCVCSIYFSDVIPFYQVISEAFRVLRSGGIFIHYGPLEFHFKQFHLMIALEELILEIENKGFQILEKDSINTTHCRSQVSKTYKTYRVWRIVAKKL